MGGISFDFHRVIIQVAAGLDQSKGTAVAASPNGPREVSVPKLEFKFMFSLITQQRSVALSSN